MNMTVRPTLSTPRVRFGNGISPQATAVAQQVQTFLLAGGEKAGSFAAMPTYQTSRGIKTDYVDLVLDYTQPNFNHADEPLRLGQKLLTLPNSRSIGQDGRIVLIDNMEVRISCGDVAFMSTPGPQLVRQ